MGLIEEASAARQHGETATAVGLLHRAFLELSRANDIDGVKRVLAEAQLLAEGAEPPSAPAEWVAQQTRLYLRAWDTNTDWDAEIATHQARLDRDSTQARREPPTQRPNPPARTDQPSGSRLEANVMQTQKPASTSEVAAVDLTPLGFWLAIAGTAAITIAVFLPEISSTTFGNVAHNTLIQNGGGWGWVFLFLALTDLGAIYRAYRAGQRTWAPLISGIIIAGYAIHLGTSNSNLRLCSVIDPTLCSTGTPGIGLYLTELGGVLLVAAGWFLRKAAPTASFTPITTADAIPATERPRPDTLGALARFCARCGTAFEPHGDFCPGCGSPRPIPAPST